MDNEVVGLLMLYFLLETQMLPFYQLATPSLPVDAPRWMSCALRKILRLECERFSMFHARYKLSERTDEAKFWIRQDSVWKIDWPLHLELFTGALEPQTSTFECMKQAWELHHSAPT